MAGKLDRRVALVTGGGGGIGRAIALALGAEGARVAVLDQNGCTARRTALEIEREGGVAEGHFCDVRRGRMIDSVVSDIVERWGTVDVLVNNAGVGGPFQRTDAIDDRTWELVLETNLGGTFRMTRRVLPEMARGAWGRVINVSSVQGTMGAALSGAYVASKHGVIGFTKTVALEWGTRGITANAICPGYVDTPMGVQPDRIPDHLESVLARSAIKRIAEPSEIASLAVYLASPDAGYVTGSVIAIDGGITAG